MPLTQETIEAVMARQNQSQASSGLWDTVPASTSYPEPPSAIGPRDPWDSMPNIDRFNQLRERINSLELAMDLQRQRMREHRHAPDGTPVMPMPY